MVADVVGVVEAAYRFDGSDERWLKRILAAARPSVDEGFGLVAFGFDVSDPARFQVGPLASIASPRGWRAAATRANSELDPQTVNAVFGGRPVGTVSEILGPAFPNDAFRRNIYPLGIRDMMGIVAADPTGRGCVLCVPLREQRTARPAEVALWSRVAAHIAAALRVRRQLAALPGADLMAGAEAVVSPGGKLEHAEEAAQSPAARVALRQAALALDRARRASQRSRPDEAVELWRALVAGRWSLVDHFDHDGRRFLVARRNDPAPAPHAALSLRERQVAGYASLGHGNKLIGYELGLSASTVGTHLGSAAAKLGVGSREALVGVWAAGSSDKEAAVSRFDIGGGEHAVMGVPIAELPGSLTASERELIAPVLRGASNVEIAQARGTSARTVANELAAIYRKLGVRSRAELAARLAVR